MGATQSKTKVMNEALNTLSSEKIQQIRNTCTASQVGTNVFEISGSGNVFEGTVEQVNTIQNACVFKTVLNEMSEGDINSNLASELIKSQEAGLFGMNASNTDLYSKLSNVVSLRELVSTVNTCVQNVNVQNLFKISGDSNVVKGTFNQTNSAFNDCLFDTLSSLATKNGITASVDTSVKESIKSGISLDFLNNPLVWLIVGALFLLFFLLR